MSKKQKIDPDYFLALTLQKKFNEEYKNEKSEKAKGSHSSMVDIDLTTSPVRKVPATKPNLNSSQPRSPGPISSTPFKSFSPVRHGLPSSDKVFTSSQGRGLSLNDSQWEVIDPTPDVHGLFVAFGKRFFQDRLGSVEVKWSKRMTSCAGVCRFKGRRDRFGRGIGEVTISLSEPLLKLRPRSDLVNTLLHEMIHAYLFLFTENPNRADRDDHGMEFQQHMNKINKEAGTRITIYHTFHDEVRLYKQHWWQCNGPCKSRPPFFGLVKRATNRAPGKYDFWFASHQAECGGQFIKIKEPDNFKARGPRKNKENLNTTGIAGGKLGAITAPSSSSSNVVGFGKPGPSGSKHVPIPGQPKIVGFIDRNKSPAPSAFGKGKPSFTSGGPLSGVRNPSNTLGEKTRWGNTGVSLGSGTALGGGSGNKLGVTFGNEGRMKVGEPSAGKFQTSGKGSNSSERFYKLGSPLNNSNLSGTFASPSKSFRPNSTLSDNGLTRPSNPIGSKLLDKLNFDNKSIGTNKNGGSNKTRADKKGIIGTEKRTGRDKPNSTGGRNGFSGARGGGTRMNTGSGTVLLNPTRTASAEPNQTAERITKPVNENRLNLDTFKPFQGQGQALGGGNCQPDRSRSRLLANESYSNTKGTDTSGTANKGNNSRDDGFRKNFNDRRLNSKDNTYRDSGFNCDDSSSSSSPAHKNKKFRLGDGSVPSQLSTNQSGNSRGCTSSNSDNRHSSNSLGRSDGRNSKSHLSWNLSEEELDDDYEYKKSNRSFSSDTSLLVETGDGTKRTDAKNNVKVNDSFYEINDEDVNVFANISDEVLSGTIRREEENSENIRGDNETCSQNYRNEAENERLNGDVQEHFRRNEEMDAANDSADQLNSSLDDIFEIHDDETEAEKHNSSLDDIFEISSNGDPEDETHCPVCNQPVARAAMGEHLDNCMELSQVFDNVVIDEDDDVNDGNHITETDGEGNEDKYHSTLDNGGIDKGRDLSGGDDEEMQYLGKEKNRDKVCNTGDVKRDNEGNSGSNLRDVDKEVEEANAISNGSTATRGTLVKCPICNSEILDSMANEHIDECLARNMSEEIV